MVVPFLVHRRRWRLWVRTRLGRSLAGALLTKGRWNRLPIPVDSRFLLIVRDVCTLATGPVERFTRWILVDVGTSGKAHVYIRIIVVYGKRLK